VSGIAARVNTPVAPRSPARARSAVSDALVEFVFQLSTFVALAAFALVHWEQVMARPPLGRSLALLALCTLAGIALWMTGRVTLPVSLARVARVAILLLLVFLGLVVSGLRPHYLWIHHWGSFGRHLHHGLLAAQGTTYPYSGHDFWERLTLQLAAPAFLVPATALAFWPGKRAATRRSLSLIVLIVFYGMALAERSPSGQVGRGFALLLLIAAWLWLPRVKLRDAGGAVWVVLCAALVAMPVAAILDSHRGWLDYKNWRVLGNTPGVSYRWNANYGPITWTRRGTTLMYVQASQPFYWKAETLDDFDGRGWLRTSANTSVNAASELPANPNRKWFHQVKFTIAGLRGNEIIGAGTPQSVSAGAGDAELFGDGTVTALNHTLHDGENYSVISYIPTPTPAQMQSGGRNYENYFGVYTRLILPENVGGGVTQNVRFDPGLWQSQSLGDPASASIAERSPYAPMYRLARRLAAKSETAYDMARNVEKYLGTSNFAYDEHPPVSKYPLESFLFKDRIGYCQQFSGAMAMLLRMVGIPARVATGFAPGIAQPDAPGVYKVRDFDAHSWVEVYFNGIGWVTFDPTPAASPASSQIDDHTARTSGDARRPPTLGGPQSNVRKADTIGVPTGGSGGSTVSWWLVTLTVVVLLAALALSWRIRRAAVRRSRMSPDERALEDLRCALSRLGTPVNGNTTLMGVERTLERRAGPDAAGYARRLREYRYGAADAQAPGTHDRRALRRALAHTVGKLRALRAVPPVHL
jgi:transglutaminase-like putative cysteine protease